MSISSTSITPIPQLNACSLIIRKNFSLFDVYAADEAFVTGSFGGITPVIKIDGRIIGNGKFGKLSRKLNQLYEQLIEEEITQKKANARG